MTTVETPTTGGNTGILQSLQERRSARLAEIRASLAASLKGASAIEERLLHAVDGDTAAAAENARREAARFAASSRLEEAEAHAEAARRVCKRQAAPDAGPDADRGSVGATRKPSQ